MLNCALVLSAKAGWNNRQRAVLRVRKRFWVNGLGSDLSHEEPWKKQWEEIRQAASCLTLKHLDSTTPGCCLTSARRPVSRTLVLSTSSSGQQSRKAERHTEPWAQLWVGRLLRRWKLSVTTLKRPDCFPASHALHKHSKQRYPTTKTCEF